MSDSDMHHQRVHASMGDDHESCVPEAPCAACGQLHEEPLPPPQGLFIAYITCCHGEGPLRSLGVLSTPCELPEHQGRLPPSWSECFHPKVTVIKCLEQYEI